MQNRVLRNIVALITAMLFIAGCDQYSSWGPSCVKPVDNFKLAKSVEVTSTKNEWVNTNIVLNSGDKLEVELQQDDSSIPVTLCGRQEYTTGSGGARNKISFNLNANSENWTNAPSDIPKLLENDAVYINIGASGSGDADNPNSTGSPNSATGATGNKWATQPISTTWDDSQEVFADDNNACVYPDHSASCWLVYGNQTSYRIAPNTSSTSPATTYQTYDLTPYILTLGNPDIKIKDVDEMSRRLVIIDPVPTAGYLQFRMNDNPGAYSNNPGGYTMNITHYGCPRKNGDGLVAYIGTDTPDASTAPTWASNFLSLDDNDKYVLKADSFPEGGGTLWFKIDDPDNDYTPGPVTVATGTQDTSNQGSYIVNLKLISATCTTPPCDPEAPNHIISTVVEYIVNQIEGVLRNAQQDLFEGLAGTNGNRVGSLVNFIRACLVLYIGIYGTAFAFGLVQSPQLDFIKRVFKVAIVIQLLGPNAWNFFNTYFFTIFTDGTKYIIYILNNLFDSPNASAESANAWVAHMNSEWAASGQGVNFDFLDRTVGQFLEQKFWIKLISLLFAGPFGWLYIIAIVIGMIIFVKGVFKAILAYIIALIAMAMLIGIAPLFIIFILFSQTKDLFEAWIQQLVNYALRPILMFTALAIFNFLMWAVLIRMMSYGACWKCILNIKFDVDFLPNMCVLYFYQPFTYDNFGDVPNTIMPISFFAVLTYLILAALTEKFVPFMEGLASSITGSTVKASILAPAASIANDLKKPVGMDKKSVERRAKAKADDKKVAAIKRGMIADRTEAKNKADRQAGGRGMSDFDKGQKAERQAELAALKKGGEGTGSVKDRAKMFEDQQKRRQELSGVKKDVASGRSMGTRADVLKYKLTGEKPAVPPKPSNLPKPGSKPTPPPKPMKRGNVPPPPPMPSGKLGATKAGDVRGGWTKTASGKWEKAEPKVTTTPTKSSTPSAAKSNSGGSVMSKIRSLFKGKDKPGDGGTK